MEVTGSAEPSAMRTWVMGDAEWQEVSEEASGVICSEALESKSQSGLSVPKLDVMGVT